MKKLWLWISNPAQQLFIGKGYLFVFRGLPKSFATWQWDTNIEQS